jgi:hypothetical protein
MGKHERQAVLSQLRQAQDADLHNFAIHEAGHAIARLIVAKQMGLRFSETISKIEMIPEAIAGPGEVATQEFQGGTYGPILSREFEAAEKAGATVLWWFCMRVFIAVSGGVAEAISCESAFYDLWDDGGPAIGDQIGIYEDSEIAKIPVNGVELTIHRMAALSALIMKKPAVWKAIERLASTIKSRLVTKGVDAAAIVSRLVSESTLASLFLSAADELDRLKRIIEDAEVVTGRTPEGNIYLIKGSQSVASSELPPVTAQVIACSSGVLCETLWRAFGDTSTDLP